MRSVARTRANHGLLSLFLSRGRANHRALVFSSIFAMVESVGTLRMNLLLRGNKYVKSPCSTSRELLMALRSMDAQSMQALVTSTVGLGHFRLRYTQ
jgi:hypothetical protein